MLPTECDGFDLSRGTEKMQDTAEIFNRLRGKPRFLTEQLVSLLL